jgi:hypothetical protein
MLYVLGAHRPQPWALSREPTSQKILTAMSGQVPHTLQAQKSWMSRSGYTQHDHENTKTQLAYKKKLLARHTE